MRFKNKGEKMKIKWFTMFDNYIRLDPDTGEVDVLKTLGKRWINAFHDPFFWILVGVNIILIYFITLG